MNYNILLLVLSVLIFSIVTGILFLLQIRKYRYNLTMTQPVRCSSDTENYREFFAGLTTFALLLPVEKVQKGVYLASKYIPRISLPRPIFMDKLRFHLLNAFGNLSEVARTRFATNDTQFKHLKALFLKLNSSIFAGQKMKTIHLLADYYRMLRVPNAARSYQQHSSLKKLLHDLDYAKKSIDKYDAFGAYSRLVSWHDPGSYTTLGDEELLGLERILGRLQSFLQGSRYYLEKNRIISQFVVLSQYISNLISALSNNDKRRLLNLI